ncbi:divalent-cation tolerance protein CutA [Kitasatospora sp. SUK 42]|uniref:divalent-cation tolerance protein CutA n=1 Tax=Kitasatospora sp. SUK 42 TaxID=1588882 RepID=UPI0027E228D8|nr:divalent-cation tolerance protein CutA [Kitasatospora sp. SUK 42]
MITTVDSEAVGAKLSRSAVEAGLAASGQVTGPVSTTYRHLGEMCEGTEWQVTFRTTEDRVAELERHVVAEHPYDNPEVISLPILSGPSLYLDWITRATRPVGS